MKISICILTYNRKDILDDLLKSLSSLISHDVEVIVIDNHSDDQTQNVKDDFKNIKYYRTESNIGVAARNISLKMATGDIIICLDDDVFGIGIDQISEINYKFKSEKNLGALNFKVINTHTGEICNWVHHCKVEEWHDKTFSTYEITEGAVAFSRQALQMAGLYPDYFFLSHEGPDLALRIINSGYDVKYTPAVVVQHYHATSGRKPWYRYFYDTRNQFLLAVRNFPVSYAFKYLIRGISSTFIYSVRDGKIYYWAKGVASGLFNVGLAYRDRDVLNRRTMAVIGDIDRNRPGLLYMAKKRLFRRGMRL